MFPTNQKSDKTTHTVFLGLGSNLGDRDSHLREALTRLAPVVHVEAVSSVYDTAPQLVKQQPRFRNAACKGSTFYPPLDLLHELKEIERILGRTAGIRYGPRIIDLDLLLYDAVILETPELTLPHPRMAERAFVLAPLAEIAPAVIHPVLHRTIAELAQQIADADVKRIGPLLPGNQ